MELPILLSMGMAALCADVARSAEPFTPEQVKAIEKMLQEQRMLVRKEILEELAAKKTEDAELTKNPVAAGDKPPRSPGEAVGMPDRSKEPLSGDIVVVPLDRGLRGGLSGLELESNGDTGVARATLSRVISGGYGQGREIDGAITLTAPIDDKDNKRSNFATLDGLSNGLALKFALTHASTGKIAADALRALCDAVGVGGDKACTIENVRSAAEASADPKSLDAYRKFEDSQYTVGRIWEGRIAASRKKYEYLSPVLGKLEDTKVGWSVGGSFALATPRRRALYAFGFDVQRTYKENDPQVFCTAPVDPYTVCKQGRLGEPAQNYKRLLWVEARTDLLKIPFSLRITRDLAADETGVDLPIYLFRGKDKPFAGGVRWGWTSEKGSDIGIFVSSSFDVAR
jgi:hypothetical protein